MGLELATWTYSDHSNPILFVLFKLGQKCIEKEYANESPAEEELASRIVEFAQCQGALRACHAGSTYEELSSSFAVARRKSVRGLWWGVLGNMLTGMDTAVGVLHDFVGELPVCHRHCRAV